MNGVAEVTNLSYQNANRLVMKFQELGILRQMDTYRRNRRFIYSDYLAMFADEVMPKDMYQGPSLLEEEKTEYFT